MAKVNVAIKQTDLTVSRSVARNIVKDIIEYTGFPKDAEIILDNKQGGPRMLSGFANPCGHTLRTENRNYVFTTLTERFTEEGIVYDRRPNDRAKRIFADDDIGVSMWPLYSEVQLELAMRFRTRDLSTMTNWTRALRLVDGLRSMVRYHNIKYDYSLPDSFMDYIIDVHKMTENQAPRGKSLKEFVKEGFNEGLILRQNLSGTHKEPVINEVQNNLTGLTVTEQSYNGIEIEDGIYELQLSYRIDYRQVVGVQLVTPILIHNAIIPERYMEAWFKPLHVHEPFGFVPKGWIPEKLANGDFERFYKGDGGARLIPFDDYFPTEPRDGVATVFLAPIMLDSVQPNKACNLTEIPDGLLPDSIKRFILANRANGANYYQSVIVIEVIENYSEERKLQTSIEANGDVLTDAPMFLDRRNYIKIDIHKDLSVFNTKTLDAWMEEPELFFELCSYIDPGLTFNETNVLGKGWVKYADGSLNKQSFYAWLKTVKGVSEKYKQADKPITRTVSSSTLIARRSN